MFTNSFLGGGNFESNSLSLFRNLNRLSLLLIVKISEDFDFVFQGSNDVFLRLDLCIVVTLKGGDADFKSLLSSLEVFNGSSDAAEVSIKVFMRLDFGSVTSNDSVSDANTLLSEFIRLGVFILNFLVLDVLSLLSIFSMLLVKAIGLSGLNINNFILSHESSWWKTVNWSSLVRNSDW